MADTQRTIEALYGIVRAIQSVADLPQLLSKIMAESKSLLAAEASSLFLYDEASNELSFEVVIGDMSDEARAIRIPADQGIVGAAAQSRRTQLVNKAGTDDRHFKDVDAAADFVTRNLIATPMIRNDRLIGVLEVLNKRDGGMFDDTDAKLLEIMAEHAAAAIENARLIQNHIRAERLAAIGTATTSLAHYIKNILQLWNGSTELIDHSLERGDLQTVQDVWPMMKRSADKVGRLVQEMLAIAATRELQPGSTDLNAIVGEIMQDCAATAAATGIKISSDLDQSLPAIRIDAAGMHDSILNLVENAFDALEDAGAKAGRIRLGTAIDIDRSEIIVRVEDNGPGITSEQQARIFEPFVTTKGAKGTGLGLAVVKKTVEEHGGTVSLQSSPGSGTTFTLHIPLIPT